jgi:DNA-binding response OmpR family regulator
MALTFLIIGSPGRLRDALRTFLHAIMPAAELDTANDFESGYATAAKKQPSLVIIDGSELLDSDCHLLRQMLSGQKPSRCLVIADTLKRATSAREAGADDVILQGFSIQTLRHTLLAMNTLPQDSLNGRPQDPIKPMTAGAPLQRKL